MLNTANHHIITDHFILPVEEIFNKQYSSKFADQIRKNFKDASPKQLNNCLEYIKDTTSSMTNLPSPNKCSIALHAVKQGYTPVAERKQSIEARYDKPAQGGIQTVIEYSDRVKNWNGYPRNAVLELSNQRDRESAWDWIAFFSSLQPNRSFYLKFALRKLNERGLLQVPARNLIDFEPSANRSARLDTSKNHDKGIAESWARYFKTCDFWEIANEINEKAKAGHQVQVPTRNLWIDPIYYA